MSHLGLVIVVQDLLFGWQHVLKLDGGVAGHTMLCMWCSRSCVCGCVSTIYMCGSQRTSFRNWFSPSTVGLGDRTQVTSLVANTFTCWVPAPQGVYMRSPYWSIVTWSSHELWSCHLWLDYPRGWGERRHSWGVFIFIICIWICYEWRSLNNNWVEPPGASVLFWGVVALISMVTKMEVALHVHIGQDSQHCERWDGSTTKDNRSLISPGPTQCKPRTNSCKLFSDLYTTPRQVPPPINKHNLYKNKKLSPVFTAEPRTLYFAVSKYAWFFLRYGHRVTLGDLELPM